MSDRPPLEPGEKVIGITQIMRERYANGSILHDRHLKSYVYPLDDETIERLAKVAHNTYWELVDDDSDDDRWDGAHTGDEERQSWRDITKAILADLVVER
jgi:hypothetical protein